MKKLLILLVMSMTGCVVREYRDVKCYPAGQREVIHCSPNGQACVRQIVPLYRCY